MKFNIVLPEGVPPTMAAVYAQESHRQAEARQEAEQEKQKTERENRERIAATLEQLKQDAVKRNEQEAKARGERERERFENQLHEAFIASNPGATEGDWTRNKQTILDEAMRKKTLEGFESIKSRKRASGTYGDF